MGESGLQKKNEDGRRFVSASELGEFDYCALSWYFTREGYRPSQASQKRMDNGTVAHREAEEEIESGNKMSVTIGIALAIVAVVLVVLFL